MTRARGARIAAVALPLVLVGLYMASNASATLSQRSLRERWDAAVTGGRLSPATLAARSYRTGEPVARIAAPSIGLDVIVVEGGNTHRAPAHLSSTAIPGSNGVSIVRGGRFGYGNLFAGLSRLTAGDDVYAQNLAGTTHFVVASVTTRKTIEVGADSEDPVLELVGPARAWGSTELIVVRAVLASRDTP